MLDLNKYGYIRVGAAIPYVVVGDTSQNANEIIRLINEAFDKYSIKVLVFPELSITGYTCADLFHQKLLIDSSLEALKHILDSTCDKDILVAAGMPVEADNCLFNCAVLFYRGKVLCVVPKTYVPNYSEFYEKRWFTSEMDKKSKTVNICGFEVPFGANTILKDKNSSICIAAEICEDLWTPVPPSSYHALYGANLILNLSASNEIIGKNDYRADLVKQQSARCVAGYVYCSAGEGESVTDLIFGGHSLIAENGVILDETIFAGDSKIIYQDIDIEKLEHDRIINNVFLSGNEKKDYSYVEISFCNYTARNFEREIPKNPFVPGNKESREKRCKEIFNLQKTALAQRLKRSGYVKPFLAVSGGLDSTLALLVIIEAIKYLNLPMTNIYGVTMPGFGTTGRTYNNSITLMKELGITLMEIPIKDVCLQHFRDIGHDADIHDVTYENAQARERTQIIMDLANKNGGTMIGTGDLSELALGFCTYNGDHMSMYAVNSGIPKTLVRYLVRWYADISDNKNISAALYDILDTPVSPELLPPDKSGKILQETENIVGPYELHDFFLYNMMRNGFTPSKIFMLAKHAFKEEYTNETIIKWMKIFYRRFFNQQFKRSCMPDGVKVGSVCLSPRGDWKMPSDASSRIWLDEINLIEQGVVNAEF